MVNNSLLKCVCVCVSMSMFYQLALEFVIYIHFPLELNSIQNIPFNFNKRRSFAIKQLKNFLFIFTIIEHKEQGGLFWLKVKKKFMKKEVTF